MNAGSVNAAPGSGCAPGNDSALRALFSVQNFTYRIG